MTSGTPSTWFERTGAVAYERGELSDTEIKKHLQTCDACRQAFADVEAVRRDLAVLPAAPPRDHWEQAVWAGIDEKRTARSPSSRRIAWNWAWLPVAAMGAAVFAVFAVGTRSTPPDEIADGPAAFTFRIEKSADQARTRGDVTVGDTLVMEANAIVGAVAELRVYQDNAGLRFRCAGEPPCERAGSVLRGRWKVPAIGRYRLLVVSSANSLPSATNSFDDDFASLANRPGVSVRALDTVEVW
jgi:hypothetical protein